MTIDLSYEIISDFAILVFPFKFTLKSFIVNDFFIKFAHSMKLFDERRKKDKLQLSLLSFYSSTNWLWFKVSKEIYSYRTLNLQSKLNFFCCIIENFGTKNPCAELFKWKASYMCYRGIFSSKFSISYFSFCFFFVSFLVTNS